MSTITYRKFLLLLVMIYALCVSVHTVFTAGSPELDIHNAVRQGDIEAVQALIAQGNNVNIQDFRKCTPLMYAVEYEYSDIVALLLEHGADMRIRNKRGETALAIAEDEDNDYIVFLLKEKEQGISVATQVPSIPQEELQTTQEELQTTQEDFLDEYRTQDSIAYIKEKDDIVEIVNALHIAPEDSTKWAFIIGAEDYLDTDNIVYARRSAELFAETIQKIQGIPQGHMYTLYNEKATSGAIKSRLQLLLEKGISKGDTIYFYYNGHGIPAPQQGNTPYILPTDMTPEYVSNEAFFQVQNLYQMFENSKAGKVVVFLDSCFTGKTDGVSVFKDVAATHLKPKQVDISTQGKLVVFSAGESDQFSNAYTAKKHRLFSYYLIKALAENKNPTMNQLYVEIKKEVSPASRKLGPLKYQDPTIEGNTQLVF